jgi:hypothetical protein
MSDSAQFNAVSSGFRKLAACIRWADSNGTKSGQHRRVSLYQIIRGHESEDNSSQGHYRNNLKKHYVMQTSL